MRPYTESVEKVLADLDSSRDGLSAKEAKKRLETFGKNSIEQGKGTSLLKIFVDQFRSFLVYILFIAATVAFLVGEQLDAAAIFAILLINAVLGFAQEYKAEKALKALKEMVVLKTVVVRGGKEQEVNAEEIVPGDIVVLREGDKVPADMRIIRAFSVSADESMLTGESVPASKNAEAMESETPVADRRNMLFANTLVVRGKATGVVVRTGMKTEFGSIAEMITEEQASELLLNKRMEQFGKKLGMLILGLIAVLFVAGASEGIDLLEMFMLSVSLAVAAIPEGLPVVVTITLALGVQAMARKDAIVRKMAVIESLGSATVICSDKTGTLTLNEMTVKKVIADGKEFEVEGRGYGADGRVLYRGKESGNEAMRKLAVAAASCNDAIIEFGEEGKAQNIIGDPTEICLKVLAEKAGVEPLENRLAEIPFSSERKMMSTLHKKDGGSVIFLKGAPENVLGVCDRELVSGKEEKLTGKRKRELMDKADSLAGEAYRMLAVAYKDAGGEPSIREKNLVLLGMVALLDPPRKEVKGAIREAVSAGISVKIITGDNPVTAKAIAGAVGLKAGRIITGSELENMPDEELKLILPAVSIFARADPKHKHRIVTLLQEMGEVVGVTGDGVNDAPALKKSDIGIAMGIKGTEVSKGAADVILKDDNFATIVSAIAEGRRIYQNIKSFIKYMLAANFGEIAVVGSVVLMGFPLPLLPLQILWINLVTDSLPALALGTEKAERGIMKRGPRPKNEDMFGKFLVFILCATLLLTILCWGAFAYGMGLDAAAGVDLGDTDLPSKARTMVFSMIVFFELAFVFSCREENKTALQLNPFGNRPLVMAVIASFLLQLAAIYLPFMQEIFGTAPLSGLELGLLATGALVSIAVPYIAGPIEGMLGKRKPAGRAENKK